MRPRPIPHALGRVIHSPTLGKVPQVICTNNIVYNGYKLYNQEDFLALKQLHQLMLQDLIATRKFERWLSKYPKHRKGPRPPCYGTKSVLYYKVQTEYNLARRLFANQEVIMYGKTLSSDGLIGPTIGSILPQEWKPLLDNYRKYKQIG